MRTLLLFDIDGTILLTGGAGMRAMKRASASLFGEVFSWKGVDASGGLDPVLLAQAARQSGRALRSEDAIKFRELYTEILEEELSTRARDVITMPGIIRLVEHVRSRADATLGLLTGNYARAAALKLRAAGLDVEWFRVRVFGDEAGTRGELAALARRKHEAAIADSVAPESVIVIGDTPKDVDCALVNGFVSVAVATGRYSIEELRVAGAHITVQDFSDPAPLLELLSSVRR
jgi:phosphoglycolate phosphatase